MPSVHGRPSALGRRDLHSAHRAGKDLYIEPRPGLLLNMRHVIWIKHEYSRVIFCTSDHQRNECKPVHPITLQYDSDHEAQAEFAQVLKFIRNTPL